MIKICSKIANELNVNRFSFAVKKKKIINLHQRVRQYTKHPEKYKRHSVMRPPNLK
jgi:hypothetical protein